MTTRRQPTRHHIAIAVAILAALMTPLLPPAPALAQSSTPAVKVYLDTLPVEFDVRPIIVGGRTMVPFRAIAEAFGAQVSWDGATSTASARIGSTEVVVPVGKKTATRNGQPVALDVPAQNVGGRILMPLRFFAEAFSCLVDWEQATYTVRITSPPRAMEVVGFYALGDAATPSWPDVFGAAYPATSKGNTDLLRSLALGWYSLDAGGRLLTSSQTGWQRPDGWERVLEAASGYGLKTDLTVHMTDGQGDLSALISSEEARQAAAGAIAAEAARYGYSGVDLDLEGLGYREQGAQLQATRAGFTALATAVAHELAGTGRTLTLTLHAPNSAYPGYDYAALGRIADRIVVMAYSYGPKPEPIDLVRAAVVSALADVPASKLILGLSADSETPASVISKVGLAKRYGLGGIAIWRLGIVSDPTWQALRSMIAAR